MTPNASNTRVKIGPKQPVLTLYRGPQVWMVTYSGYLSDEIRHLFGTTTIPTAYGISVPSWTVHEIISTLNPTAVVMLESSEHNA